MFRVALGKLGPPSFRSRGLGRRTVEVECDLPEGRGLAPVAVEARDAQPFSRHPLGQAERSGPVGVGVELLAGRALRHDRDESQLVEENGERLRRADADGERVDGRGRIDVQEIARHLEIGRPEQAIHRVDDVAGIEPFPAVEPDVGAEMKDPGRGIGVFPAAREARLDLHAGVGRHERLEDLGNDRERGELVLRVRIELDDFMRHRNAHGVERVAPVGAPASAEAPRRRGSRDSWTSREFPVTAIAIRRPGTRRNDPAGGRPPDLAGKVGDEGGRA